MKTAKIVNIADMREAARRRLPKVVFDYIDGAAEDEVGKARNASGFRDITVTPRYLVDVAERAQATEIFGQTYASPFGLGPTGMANIAWPDADIALAEAAAAANLPFTLSTAASSGIEDIAPKVPDHFWFQVYAQRDRNVTGDLFQRAADAGAKVLMVTVDTPIPAKRERDIRNGFILPLKLSLRHIADAARRPGWSWQFIRNGAPRFETIAPYADPSASAQSLAAFIASQVSPSLTWDDVGWMRDAWEGPLVLKGLTSVADCELAKARGVDGVLLSNHGGRNFDPGPAPIAVLPAVRKAVGADMVVMLDSGIRRGSDIGKAIALGADFCLVGRATLYGVAAAGRAGVDRSLAILQDELDRFLGQSGHPDVKDLRNAEVARAGDPAA
jgi:(S)-mandelate dehydrogenase